MRVELQSIRAWSPYKGRARDMVFDIREEEFQRYAARHRASRK